MGWRCDLIKSSREVRLFTAVGLLPDLGLGLARIRPGCQRSHQLLAFFRLCRGAIEGSDGRIEKGVRGLRRWSGVGLSVS